MPILQTQIYKIYILFNSSVFSKPAPYLVTRSGVWLIDSQSVVIWSRGPFGPDSVYSRGRWICLTESDKRIERLN